MGKKWKIVAVFVAKTETFYTFVEEFVFQGCFWQLCGTQSERKMKKCNVYTRKGDGGETSLADGKRVAKCCSRLEAYGSVDELNSLLGLLLTYMEDEATRDRLVRCQNELFSVGSLLACENPGQMPVMLCEEDVEDLEKAIDATADGLPGWRGFTLPGGCRAAALAHVCRTVCRRAERHIYRLAQEAPVDGNVCCYMNRLSDYLYVLACKMNQLNSVDEIFWRKNLP